MKIKFKILGSTYTIESEDSEEYIQKIAKYVSSKCEEIEGTTKEIDKALLVAFDIADELFQEREFRIREKAVVERSVALLEKKLGSL